MLEHSNFVTFTSIGWDGLRILWPHYWSIINKLCGALRGSKHWPKWFHFIYERTPKLINKKGLYIYALSGEINGDRKIPPFTNNVWYFNLKWLNIYPVLVTYFLPTCYLVNKSIHYLSVVLRHLWTIIQHFFGNPEYVLLVCWFSTSLSLRHTTQV